LKQDQQPQSVSLSLKVASNFPRVPRVYIDFDPTPWNPLEWIADRLQEVVNFLLQQIKKAIDWLWGAISPLFNWIYDKLTRGIEYISARLGSTAQWIKSQIWNAARWIRDGVAGGVYSVFGEFMTSFSNWIKTLWTTVLEFLQERFVEPILRAMRWLTDKIKIM